MEDQSLVISLYKSNYSEYMIFQLLDIWSFHCQKPLAYKWTHSTHHLTFSMMKCCEETAPVFSMICRHQNDACPEYAKNQGISRHDIYLIIMKYSDLSKKGIKGNSRRWVPLYAFGWFILCKPWCWKITRLTSSSAVQIRKATRWLPSILLPITR